MTKLLTDPVLLSSDEAAWLGSLTGDIPRDYIAPPTLPAAVRQ